MERHIKSEEAPKDNSGPVRVVTANTFDEIVFGGKDVLVEFYAPWCGHCKALTPIYEQVTSRALCAPPCTVGYLQHRLDCCCCMHVHGMSSHHDAILSLCVASAYFLFCCVHKLPRYGF